MSGAGVGAVLTALVTTYTNAAPTGVLVSDGEATDPPRRFLCVGWDESEQPAVQASRNPNDVGLALERETLDVSCLLSCWAGNESSAQLRTDTLTLYDAFDAALAANRQLGGAAMLARVTGYEYAAQTRTEGRIAQVRFTVNVQAIN